ncbi:MAG: hypothetical protein IT290_09340 [Deltaproteobacteria bacterium]|nr:hypothetical protein [Deltaproteobacteria bacterium]
MSSEFRKRTEVNIALDSGSPWMLTFTDMLFLVLTFFVMRFATLSFPHQLRGPAIKTAPAATEPRIALFVRRLEAEIGHQLSAGPTVERSGATVSYPAGVHMQWVGTSVSIKLSTQFVGDSSELPFQTVSLLRSTAKLAAAEGYFLDISVPTSAEANDKLVTLATMLTESGLAPDQVGLSFSRSRGVAPAITLRFSHPDKVIPSLR